jgi:colanic acid/amylovoran biosynthesis glycosyltransferase
VPRVPERVVAHVVREAGLLTEPFIERRMTVDTRGFRPQLWSERGRTSASIEKITVPSRFIAPGSVGARLFHRVPSLGSAQRRMYRALAELSKPDVIHAHYLTTGYLAATCGRPLVVSAYGFDLSVMARRRLWRRAFRSMFVDTGAVLVEGPYMRERVIELGMPGSRVCLVPIAVGHEDLSFIQRPVLDRDPRILTAGRFVEKKGFELAIAAFAQIHARHPASRLVVVGSGPLDGQLRSLAAASAAHTAIQFVGRLSRTDYLATVADADLFLAPSVTARNGDSEGGAPTTILDAQALGTIVVASTHADIPFLVEDGVTGFLGQEGSLDAITNAIERALAARDRWPTIAETARHQVVTRHDDATLGAALSAVYEEVLW